MTTITDNGLEHVGDRLIFDSPRKLDYMAVGTGANETNSASDLGSRSYEAPKTNSNVSFVEANSTGGFEAKITVKGGTEVSAGTDVSEVGVYAGDPDGSGILVVVDAFNDVTVSSGITKEFTVPINPTR